MGCPSGWPFFHFGPLLDSCPLRRSDPHRHSGEGWNEGAVTTRFLFKQEIRASFA